jgi:hypothetical protein
VLRALPPLAKQYVMRLLYVQAAVPIAALEAGIRATPPLFSFQRS